MSLRNRIENSRRKIAVPMTFFALLTMGCAADRGAEARPDEGVPHLLLPL